MFPDLVSPLGWSEKILPEGKTVLVTDKGLDGSFLLHHFLGIFLKGNQRVCLVSFAQTYNHYNLVARKLGINLQSYEVSNKFMFVDCVSQLLHRDESSGDASGSAKPAQRSFTLDWSSPSRLKALYDMIRDFVVSAAAERTCVILDGMDLLITLGVPQQEVYGLHRYLTALTCGGVSDVMPGCLVTLLHDDVPAAEEDEDLPSLCKVLAHTSDMTLRASSLQSGYSREVHGQLVVEMSSTAPQPSFRHIQFKAKDQGVSFFALGMSSAVL